MKAISGIYIIANSRNGKFYIGSAKYFKTRKTDHFRQLRGNYHHCVRLQNAYNKEHDKSVFVFMPIFHCFADEGTLLRTEQWFLNMNRHNQEKGTLYNSSMIAGRPEHTPEVCAKISAAKKGKPAWNKGISPSAETCTKISIRLKGRTSPNKGRKLSTEHCANLSAAHKGKPALKTRGKAHWNAKLTEEDIFYIRASTDCNVALAKKFGVSKDHISDIRRNKTWKYLKNF